MQKASGIGFRNSMHFFILFEEDYKLNLRLRFEVPSTWVVLYLVNPLQPSVAYLYPPGNIRKPLGKMKCFIVLF